MLKEAITETDKRIDKALLAQQALQLSALEIGRLRRVQNGIAGVSGLRGVKSMELLKFSDRGTGLAFNLDSEEVGVVLLSHGSGLKAGTEVRRTGRVVGVPVGLGLLGRVINGLGMPLDDKGPVKSAGYWPIERKAPDILDRSPVTEPLETGIKAIDALIPIGRGQRQLILGDRQTGKTAIAVDTILNQRDKNVICIYCSIGQRGTAVAQVIDTLRQHHALSYCVVVVAPAESAAGLQFITPYAATTIAEYLMAQGRNVVVVYDDLTRHAHAYRELSLLLRRPPGREAYPGDIFYIHSRLLERATHLTSQRGGGSLTALPIIETQAQNLSAYIPTNLISITDGQIYLSPDLFKKGELPAVDIGKSVSRVGGKAQLPAYRDIVGELRLAYTQFEELETFSRFGTRLDERTRNAIRRGRRVREILKQNETESLTASEQIAVLFAVNAGFFDDMPLEQVITVEHEICLGLNQNLQVQCKKINSGKLLDSEDKEKIREMCRQVFSKVKSEG